MTELDTIEMQIGRAYEELTKVREDIEEFKKTRSGLQNEIKAKRENCAKDLDEMLAKKEHELQRRSEELTIASDKTKYDLDAREKDIETDRDKIIKDAMDLSASRDVLNSEQSKFDAYKENTEKQLADEKSDIEKNVAEIAAKRIYMANEASGFDNRDIVLNTREFNADWKDKRLGERKSALDVQANENNAILYKVKQERDAHVDLKKDIAEEIKQNESLKKDILKAKAMPAWENKLEAEKVAVKKMAADNLIISKALADKQSVLKEQEKTNNEKERLNQINARKIDDKIRVLKQIRAEMGKNG